ncbi:uncharacterized protein LOC115235191 isoform X2 [Formica exsecta]|uniref:uncharacterized protein LOC115235191 isoform X2 n=1 Tax=Formica exsecta TaxID=72781 RepID=UPI00114140DB|nr:uncharacterized protein LOC115235191 isoform X2 [Formica exsecta]
MSSDYSSRNMSATNSVGVMNPDNLRGGSLGSFGQRQSNLVDLTSQTSVAVMWTQVNAIERRRTEAKMNAAIQHVPQFIVVIN